MSDNRWISAGTCYERVGKEYSALLNYMKDDADNKDVYLLMRDVEVAYGMRILLAMQIKLNKLTQVCQQADIQYDAVAACLRRTKDNSRAEYLGRNPYKNRIWKDSRCKWQCH